MANKVLDVTLTEGELSSIGLILMKKAQAQLSLDRTDFHKEMGPNLITAFYRAAGESLAEQTFAEKEWWKNIENTYNLKGIPLSLDGETGRLIQVEPPVEKVKDAEEDKPVEVIVGQ